MPTCRVCGWTQACPACGRAEDGASSAGAHSGARTTAVGRPLAIAIYQAWAADLNHDTVPFEELADCTKDAFLRAAEAARTVLRPRPPAPKPHPVLESPGIYTGDQRAAGGLGEEIRAAINRHSRENASDTPDFILADFIMASLIAFEDQVQRRERWWGAAETSP